MSDLKERGFKQAHVKPVIRLVLVLAGWIFLVEFVLMYVIELFSNFGPLTNSLIDALILIIFLAPVLYIQVFRPLSTEIDQCLLKEKELEKALYYDVLTGLPNKFHITERLTYTLSLAQREDFEFVLILLDVRNLEEVNATLGYECGDLLLKTLARRLESNLRQSDSVARLVGDEFLILLPKVNINFAVEMCRKINELVDPPFNIYDATIGVEVTMGVVVYPDHGHDSATLLRHADIAKKLAKREGEVFKIYETSEGKVSRTQLTLISEIRKSLEEDHFTLYYQPKYNFKEKAVSSVEALVRWEHPQKGLVPPGEFIPVVEKTGLIKPFTSMTLEKALMQYKSWQGSNRPVKIAVNLSARLLLDKKLPTQVFKALERFSLPPESIELEVTESAIMTNPELAQKILTELNNEGIEISIDDFGTGYTSLQSLNKLPISLIKIDQCFVTSMLQNERNMTITQSVINLGHELGFRIIAEGVEDEKTLNKLEEIGCDIVQGYFIAKPMPAEELQAWSEKSKYWNGN